MKPGWPRTACAHAFTAGSPTRVGRCPAGRRSPTRRDPGPFGGQARLRPTEGTHEPVRPNHRPRQFRLQPAASGLAQRESHARISKTPENAVPTIPQTTEFGPSIPRTRRESSKDNLQTLKPTQSDGFSRCPAVRRLGLSSLKINRSLGNVPLRPFVGATPEAVSPRHSASPHWLAWPHQFERLSRNERIAFGTPPR